MRPAVSLRVFALVLLALLPAQARAQSDDEWRYYPSAGNGAEPLDRILPEIRRNHPGRFYDAEGPFMGGDGQMHYRVKWMTPEGRIVWLETDARTGRVLGTGGGRHDYYGNENSYGRDQGYDERRGDRPDERRASERRNHFADDNTDGEDRPDRGGRDWNGPDRGGRDSNGPDRGGRDWGGGEGPDRGGRHWNGGWGEPWGGGGRHGHRPD